MLIKDRLKIMLRGLIGTTPGVIQTLMFKYRGDTNRLYDTLICFIIKQQKLNLSWEKL